MQVPCTQNLFTTTASSWRYPTSRISSISLKCHILQFRHLRKKRHTEHRDCFLLFHYTNKDQALGRQFKYVTQTGTSRVYFKWPREQGYFWRGRNPLIQGLGCNCLDLFFLQKCFRKRLPETAVFRGSEQRLVSEHNALCTGLCIQLEHASLCWFLSLHCLYHSYFYRKGSIIKLKILECITWNSFENFK